MKFRFDKNKNDKLLAERKIGFDEIIEAIDKEENLVIENHHNSTKYLHQKIIYVPLHNEVYLVPCIEEGKNSFFLKTIFPSRKARKRFLKNKKPRI